MTTEDSFTHALVFGAVQHASFICEYKKSRHRFRYRPFIWRPHKH